jgi:hypothetical protein
LDHASRWFPSKIANATLFLYSRSTHCDRFDRSHLRIRNKPPVFAIGLVVKAAKIVAYYSGVASARMCGRQQAVKHLEEP